MKERQEDSVQQWNRPTQAKTGLEWATRPLQVSTLAGVQSSQYFRKPKPVGNYSEGEDCRLYNEELVRQICRQLNNAKDDAEKERELLSLLRAVIQDNHEEARTRMEFLKKKYPQVISDAKAAD